MDKYRVGIVGCGGIAHFHGQNYNRYPNDFEIVAAADVSQESVDKYCQQFEIATAYTDYQKMLTDEHLDIVTVCTWQGTHAEITVAAAESGVKGILCEKPMAVSLGQADAMIEACEKNKVKLVIGHQRRFEAIYPEARRLLADGVIGEPISVVRRVGSGLLNWGTHVIDMTRQILGDPSTSWVIGQVERKTDRYERRCRIEDLCMGLICFENDTRLILEIDMPKPHMNNILIQGSNGTMSSDGGKLKYLNSDSSGWQIVEPKSDGRDLWSEFKLWLDGDIDDHRCSGYQARGTVEIMMAIYESVRTRGLVHIPFQTPESPLELLIDNGMLPVETPGKYDIRVPF